MADQAQTPGADDPLANAVAVSELPAEPTDNQPEGEDPLARAVVISEGEPSPEEAVGAAAKGATGGVIKGGAVVAGAYMGGQVGAVLAGPGGAGAGAIIGAGAGLLAGEPITKALSHVNIPGVGTLTFDDLASVPPHLRPYAVGGDSFGQALSFLPAPYMLAREGIRFAPNLAGRFLNGIVDHAQKVPGWFATMEIEAAASAGVGAGLAEQYFPGEGLPRMGAEIVFGAANPFRFATRLAQGTVSSAQKLSSWWGNRTVDTSMDKAQRFLIERITEAGEDPAAIAKAMQDFAAEFPHARLTAGQATSSPTLLALERRLAEESGRFGHEAKQAALDTLDSFEGVIRALEATGDPQALRLAAQAKIQRIEAVMQGRIQDMQEQALHAAAMTAPTDAASRATFGVQMEKITREALDEVRRVETELWSRVNRDTPAAASALLKTVDDIRAARLPNEKLPAEAEGFIRWLKGGDELSPNAAAEADQLLKDVFGDVPKGGAGELPELTAGLLMRFRSRLLGLSREASARNEWGNAKVFGQMAESILDDLERVQPIGSADREAFEAARSWSRTLNDHFSRSFAGDVLSPDKTGAARIPPELVMQRAFGSGREIGELQFRQLQEAAELAGREYMSRMLDQQEQALRYAATETMARDADGRLVVVPERLQQFMERNAQLLSRFPEVKALLKNAETAQRSFASVLDSASHTRQRINDAAALSIVLKGEDPPTAVHRVLTGNFPVRGMGALARLANSGGPAAQEGLKSAVLEYAFEQASKRGGFSFVDFQRVLEEPLVAKGPSLKSILVHNKVFDAQTIQVLDRFVKKARSIEDVLASQVAPMEAFFHEDAMTDFVTRYAAQHLASAFGITRAGPGSLQLATQVSKLTKQVFDKIPHGKMKDTLIELSKNPQMMATLLEAGHPGPAKAGVVAGVKDHVKGALTARQLNAFLYSSGLTYSQSVGED